MLKLGDGGGGGITSDFNPLSSWITFCQEFLVPTESTYISGNGDVYYLITYELAHLGAKKQGDCITVVYWASIWVQ